MKKVIECKNLTHYFGDKKIFKNLSFSIDKGKIVGLLGKNGVGKSTTINILMGFLEPTSGECLIYGEPSHKMSPKTKSKIALLLEGHIQYDFMNIKQIEEYYSKFFPRWKKHLYYELVDRLKVPSNQIIRKLSCGQRSQVVLGLVFAQDADLLILDDYSMGLDVGYRSLFLEYLKEYVKKHNKTVLMTTHIMQNLENILDDIIILDSSKPILQTTPSNFINDFHQYKIQNSSIESLEFDSVVCTYEKIKSTGFLYSFCGEKEVKSYLKSKNVIYNKIENNILSFEEAFIGYTGRR